ncbi:hypothetical protein GUITHDRAFT_142384 [Guillardia theta CCMP2712]|uniref:IPT/TIG domain-containing protein n=1 Tax=Guillardia theta (strain CCMP2712) TaxID=905079 RepID=L1IXN1_GUITC|nr:hypothetical protein GUITHDRAFT_142384 [Guillardia theta CCMP2712]EKX40991.1 hypothetical protein GUITHDRAFT_142384 [Guillardia theta CCMP2712]|eukprot:XP_005827971.1 hypothetical protein GUITHDRAFT_142384 [Guillardia theta CCMP2712]
MGSNNIVKVALVVMLVLATPGFSTAIPDDLHGLADRWEQFAKGSSTALQRTNFGVVEHDGQIAIFGGQRPTGNGAIYLNDLWTLQSGGEFSNVECCGWLPRMKFAYAVHIVNGTRTLFVIGGYSYNGNVPFFYSDVWATSDFARFSFVQLSPTGFLPPCSGCVAVSFKSYLFLIGGCYSSDNSCATMVTQIYYSSDGSGWQKAISDLDAITLWENSKPDNVMAAVNGEDLVLVQYNSNGNEVWSLSWDERTKRLNIGAGSIGTISSSNGGAKFSAVFLSLFSNLWLLTGNTFSSTSSSYIVYSSDSGGSWATDSTQDQQQQQLLMRERAAGIVWNKRLCVLGGRTYSNSVLSNMWCSVPPKFPAPSLSIVDPPSQDGWFSSPVKASIRTGTIPSESCAEIRFQVTTAQSPAPPTPQNILYSSSFNIDLGGLDSQAMYVYMQVTFPCSEGFTASDVSSTPINVMQKLSSPSCSPKGSISVKGSATATAELLCQTNAAEVTVSYSYSGDANTLRNSNSPASLVLVDGASTVKVSCKAPHWVDSDEVSFSFTVTREAGEAPKGSTSSSYTTTRASSPIESTPSPSPSLPPQSPSVSFHSFCCDQTCRSTCLLQTAQDVVLHLQGSNLNRVEDVRVGGRACGRVGEAAAISLVCIFAPGLGEEQVTVGWTDSGETRTLQVARIVYPAPVAALLAFSSAPPCTGATVTISGSNFGSLLAGHVFEGVASTFLGHEVRGMVGASWARQVMWVADSSVLVMAPPGAGAQLRVQLFLDGVGVVQQASSSHQFSYSPPRISSVRPSIGGAEGAMLVTLTGVNFGCTAPDPPAVLLGPQACKSVTRISDNQIICLSPPRNQSIQSTSVNVEVQVAGQSAVSPSSYLYVAASQPVTIFFSSLTEGTFSDSGLQVTELLLPSGERIVINSSANTLPSTPAGAPGGSSKLPSSQIAVIVCAVIVIVCSFCYLAPRLRSRLFPPRQSHPNFSPNVVFAQSELADGLPSIRVVSADSVSWMYSREEEVGRCEHCQRSGFRVCIHRTMKSMWEEVDVQLPPSDDIDEELCVVCLDRPRNVIIVHGNEEKTLHKVTCSQCTQRIREAGGPCPMCRQPIFDVLE